MPTEIDEGDLILSFEGPLSVERFDDEKTHGMGHLQVSMKRVDFIVTFSRETWLIEVKDPENRSIPPNQATTQRRNFRRRMQVGTLYSRELAPKLKDTLIYLALANRAPTSEIRYFVLIGLSALDAAMLLTAQERLKRFCFLPGPFMRDWLSKFDVIVFNMDAWNRRLAPNSVRRRP